MDGPPDGGDQEEGSTSPDADLIAEHEADAPDDTAPRRRVREASCCCVRGPRGSSVMGRVAVELLEALEEDTPPAPLAENLEAETLGAYRRRNGDDRWCLEARVAFAVALVEEARRRILLDRLDGVMLFLHAGATVDQAADRLDRILAELRHRPPSAARLDAAA